MYEYVYINGRYFNKDKAKVCVSDAGFLYGDGVYETLKSYSGNVFALEQHIDRLCFSLSELYYGDGINKNTVKEGVLKILEKNNLSKRDAYIKIIVTRNNYRERFRFDPQIKPNLIIIAKKLKPFPDSFYREGIKLITSTIKRNSMGNILYRHKLLNYFENIYAKNEAYLLGAQEALFTTRDRVVLECASSNIFSIKNDTIFTPGLTIDILPGITREIILKICRDNDIKVIQKRLHYYNLIEADEVFISNAIMEVMPVKYLDSHIIGSGTASGKLSVEILNHYRKLTGSV